MIERPRILLTNAIHPEAMALLEESCEAIVAEDTGASTLRRLVSDADGIIVRAKLPDDIVDHGRRLRGIVRHGVGLDFIPVDAATAAGVQVANLPGSNTRAVVEYCISALFHLRRPLASFDAQLRQKGWQAARAPADDMTEIGGITLGIVGLGAIGSELATLATCLGMNVIGAARDPAKSRKGIETVSIEQLFERADAIVLCCPLTDQTRGMVDRAMISRMRRHAILINAARGAIVNSSDLVSALAAGRIAGAALDVFDEQPLPPDHPYLSCDNLLLTPHLAGITSNSLRNMSLGAVEEMLRILRGERPLNLVNPV